MLRTALFTALTLSAALASADKATKSAVRDLPGQPANKITKADDLRAGCGLSEIARSLGTGATESQTSYSDQALTKLSAKVATHEGETISLQSVYSWCTKPDTLVRVWVACAGAGEQSGCQLFAATFDAKGKLGKAVSQTVGDMVRPTKIEDVDSSAKRAPWTGKGLKVSFSTGRGDATFGVYVDKGAVKFTKTEWAK